MNVVLTDISYFKRNLESTPKSLFIATLPQSSQLHNKPKTDATPPPPPFFGEGGRGVGSCVGEEITKISHANSTTA